MKITKKQLKDLIKEEISDLQEAIPYKARHGDYGDDYKRAREEERRAANKMKYLKDMENLGRKDATEGRPARSLNGNWRKGGFEAYVKGYDEGEDYDDPGSEISPFGESMLEENSIDDLTQQTQDAASVKRNPDDLEAEKRMRREVNFSLITEREVVDMLEEMASLYKALPYKLQRPDTRVYRAIQKAYRQLKKGSSGGSL